MPDASDADGMPETWKPDPRRQVSAILLGSPDGIFRYDDWGESDPFGTEGAMIVPVKSGVIY